MMKAENAVTAAPVTKGITSAKKPTKEAIEKVVALRATDTENAILERVTLRAVKIADAKRELSFDIGSVARLLIHRQDVEAVNRIYWKMHTTEQVTFRKCIIALMGGIEPNPEKGGFYYAPENSFLTFNMKVGFSRTIDNNTNWGKKARAAQLEACKPLLAIFSEDYTALVSLKTKPNPVYEKDYAKRFAKTAYDMPDSPLKRDILYALQKNGYGDLIKGAPAPSK